MQMKGLRFHSFATGEDRARAGDCERCAAGGQEYAPCKRLYLNDCTRLILTFSGGECLRVLLAADSLARLEQPVLQLLGLREFALLGKARLQSRQA